MNMFFFLSQVLIHLFHFLHMLTLWICNFSRSQRVWEEVSPNQHKRQKRAKAFVQESSQLSLHMQHMKDWKIGTGKDPMVVTTKSKRRNWVLLLKHKRNSSLAYSNSQKRSLEWIYNGLDTPGAMSPVLIRMHDKIEAQKYLLSNYWVNVLLNE